MLLPWVLVSAVLLAAIITMSVVCMCNYVKGGKEKSMPKSLVRLFFLQCPLVCLSYNKEMLPYWKTLWHINYYTHVQGASLTQQPKSN